MAHFLPCRLWERKRVVWSNSVIVLANVGQEIAIDCIPLPEVSSIEQVNTQQVQQTKSQSKSADSAQTRFQNALQIKTLPNGYNAGRTYYLQASSPEECQSVCSSLSLCARRARKAELAKTRIFHYQTKVRPQTFQHRDRNKRSR
jgi:hypothetical protein